MRWLLGALVPALVAGAASAEEVGSVDTEWKLIGPDHKVVVEAFDDPGVEGIACYVSRAKTGGISGAVGIAKDPSRFSIACRQVGPITMPEKLRENEEVFTADTSILFKETRVVRMFDRKRNTLVYLSYSTKMIEGSPMNAVSTVPIMPWRE